MAFNIRPPATTSANKPGAVSSKPASGAAPDLFTTHLAQSQATQAKSTQARSSAPKTPPHPAKSASKQPSQAKTSHPKASHPKASHNESSSAADEQAGTGKPDAADPSDKPAAAIARSSKGPTSKAASQSDENSAASGGDSTADDAANASEQDSAHGPPGSPGANRSSKGRTSGRAVAVKAPSSQSADPKATGALAEPSADVSNTSGLSLLQLLARTSSSDDPSVASADGAAIGDASTSAVDGDKSPSSDDPNALALAMLSQAFAAGFGAVAAQGAAGAGATGTASAGATPTGDAASDSSAAGAVDANGRSAGAPTQQLVALLAKDLAAQPQGKTDDDAAQSDVSSGGLAATKSSSDDTGPVDNTAQTAQSAAQSLAQMGVASHFTRETNTAELKAPVGSPAWNEELGGHLTWMTHRGLESGSLRVSPEHLGPVEVQISVQNGDASVWFGASHPDARAALEQALPRLREMFAGQGLTLTDSGVSREPPRNQTRPSVTHNPAVPAVSGSSEVSASSTARISLGLIDTYV